MLKPNKKESKEDFLTRAMADTDMEGAHPDEEKRKVVCESMWVNSRQIDEGVERRVLVVEDIELRVADGDDAKIAGYAAKFGKWSEDLGGFREKIRIGAFDAVMDDDVRALKNHDPNLLLGRTKSGTLRLTANKTGLRFEVDMPDTNVGRDTVEEIRRGDISGCSFGFIVDVDEWRYLQDDIVERTIISFRKLFDVGPVTYPAYPDTSVAARSLEKCKAEHRAEEQANEEPAEDEEARADAEKDKASEVAEKEKTDRNRKRKTEKGCRLAERIINRNKQAEA
ncbi:MAG TPA: HK97 family phage prohead protease [Phycisphaerales bacterium]|nr:HK97 family phage prohead protease [Phycisphaerales bacterium]